MSNFKRLTRPPVCKACENEQDGFPPLGHKHVCDPSTRKPVDLMKTERYKGKTLCLCLPTPCKRDHRGEIDKARDETMQKSQKLYKTTQKQECKRGYWYCSETHPHTIQSKPEPTKQDLRGNICKIISEMLDHPDKCGIYPTTKCYDELESFIATQIKEAEMRGVEKALALTIEHIGYINKDGEYLVKELKKLIN